jgi:hypothetical protein
MTIGEIYSIISKAKEADYVFFNFFIAPSWGIGTLIPNKSSLRFFMFGLLNIETPVIITAFGDPYVMYYCPMPVFICAHTTKLLLLRKQPLKHGLVKKK